MRVGVHADLGVQRLHALLLQLVLHVVQLARLGLDEEAFAVGAHVVGARLERGLHELVLADVLLEQQVPLLVKEVQHRARGRQFRVGALEQLANLAGGAVAVVGQDFDDDRGAARAVDLVHQLVVALGAELAACPSGRSA